MLEAYIALGIVVLVGIVIYHDTAYLKTLVVKEPSGVLNLTSFVALMSLVTAVGSLSIAKYQANLASEVFYENTRPWIGARDIGFSGGFLTDSNSRRITMNVTLENYGHSPANGVFFAPELYYADWTTPINPRLSHSLIEERRYCGSLMSPGLEKTPLGTTIFPGKTLEASMTVTQSKETESSVLAAINQSLHKFSKAKDIDVSFLDVYIIGCVLYKGRTLNDYHLTPIIMNMSRISPSGAVLAIDTKQADYPMSSLIFKQTFLSDPPS